MFNTCRHSLVTPRACSATEFSRPPAQLAGSLPVSRPGQEAPSALPTLYIPTCFIRVDTSAPAAQHNRTLPNHEIAKQRPKKARGIIQFLLRTFGSFIFRLFPQMKQLRADLRVSSFAISTFKHRAMITAGQTLDIGAHCNEVAEQILLGFEGPFNDTL
jgi:hypothetical protein